MIEEIFKSAVTYHSKKNFSKARELYESLLKTNPQNLSILLNYASLLSQIKEYEKADEAFKKCLEIKLQKNRKNAEEFRFLQEQ